MLSEGEELGEVAGPRSLHVLSSWVWVVWEGEWITEQSDLKAPSLKSKRL